MPSTSVHLPPEILERLDEMASRRGTSRNRLIVEACELLLEREPGAWPPGFFSNEHLARDELRELETSLAPWESDLRSARRNRRVPPA